MFQTTSQYKHLRVETMEQYPLGVESLCNVSAMFHLDPLVSIVDLPTIG